MFGPFFTDPNGQLIDLPILDAMREERVGGKSRSAPARVGTWQPIAATSGTDSACTNGTMYVGLLYVPMSCLVTGIQYLVGSIGGTNLVIASLHNAVGTPLANSAVAGTTVGTAAQAQQVPFVAPVQILGDAVYWLGLTFNGATAKFRSVPAYCHVGDGVLGDGVTQTFGSVIGFTPPTTFVADKVPIASLY